MYEKKNVPEPTCAGDWWRVSKVCGAIVVKVQIRGGQMMWWLDPDWHLCLDIDVVWTGPILKPEDSDWHAELIDGTALDPPAQSEDEGGKWGRRLYIIDHEVWGGTNLWETHASKRRWTQIAIRFHAECIAPLVDALEFYAYQGSWDMRFVGIRMSDATRDGGKRAREALIDQSEAPAEKKLCPKPSTLMPSTIPVQPPPLSGKPGVSDEAVADEIRAAAMMLLDGVLHAEEWLAAARRVRAMIEERAKKKEDD